jgi:hypothetical protein
MVQWWRMRLASMSTGCDDIDILHRQLARNMDAMCPVPDKKRLPIADA